MSTRKPEETSGTKRIAFSVALLLFVGLAIEGIAWFGGVQLSRRGLLYAPQPANGYASYLSRRDAVLGWPPPGAFGTDGKYDEWGSRIVPAFPDGRDACVSLYGDSYTWSEEVGPEDAWSNVLSQLLGCRVSNYGVGGYGTDQAYLRFTRNVRDTARIVVLVHFPGDIVRNVTQFRTLVTGAPQFDLKPRYVLKTDGQLELVPMPDLSEEEYLRMVEEPEAFLRHEFFLPGGPSGLRRLAFPYTGSVVRAARHPRIAAKLGGNVPYADFYDREHPSGALVLTAEIMRRFHADAIAAGRFPILVVLPDIEELERFRREGTWTYQSLLDLLDERAVPCLNLGPDLLERLGAREPRELAGGRKHYNAEGYRMVADAVFGHMKSEGLLR
jgi:hypothetical protein